MELKLRFKEYNEALKQNKLLGLRCRCGRISPASTMVCSSCDSTDLQVVELKGKGRILTLTSLFVVPEGRESECPYVVAIIDLDEGVAVMGNLTGVDPNKVSADFIGKRVKMSGIAVFPGDKYSAGEVARPLFSLE